ncbi:hypothetical protein [Luteococcus sp.]|uniref:hypothetical protein n=1 Tax=Luteococcus sp. TaxID=1969402 RepID=UPI0037354F6E
MIITTATTTLGTWAVCAREQDYDGVPPVNQALFDRAPRTLHPERLAVGSFLLFRPWISGTFTAGEWTSPAVAQAIADAAQPIRVQCTGIDQYAKTIAKGIRTVAVSTIGTSGGQVNGALQIAFPRSDQRFGAHRDPHGEVVPSNAWLLAAAQDDARRAEVTLGCAVLFAEDLGVSRLHIPMAVSDSLRELLLTTGLSAELPGRALSLED